MKLKIGELLEVTAVDHTSEDTNGWCSADEMVKASPERLTVAGYFVGETKDTLRLAMAKAGTHYGTQFMIVKAAIERIKKCRT